MNKEKKAFIQEQIVQEKKNKMKKNIYMLIKLCFCAILFGTIANVAFHFTDIYLDEMLEEKNETEVSLNNEKVTNKEEKKKEIDEEKTATNTKKEEKVEPVVIEQELTLENVEELYDLLRKTAKQYNHSIVTVTGVVEGVDWFDNPSKIEEAAYGVVLAEDEKRFYILTKNETVKEVESIQIIFYNGASAKAKVRGKDEITNLAILSVAKGHLSKEDVEEIKVASLGDSYSLTEGNFVMALGSPNGYMYSMDFGMISGQKREHFIVDGKMEVFNTNMAYYTKGEGIVVDIDGKVIGLITHSYKDNAEDNIFTMVGISRLKMIIEKMINKQKMPYLGVVANDIPEEQKEKLGVENGIYVTEVENNSPALETGIRVGDVIVEIGGTRISSLINFCNLLAEFKPEDEIKMKIVRTSSGLGEEREIVVYLGKR